MKPILLQGHQRSITQIKYNREGDLLFSSAKDKNPNVWFSLNGERLGTYNGHNGAVWCIDVDWESINLMSGAADATCKIWDVQTGQIKHNFVCANGVRSCEFAYSGNLAMYTTDSTLKESCYIIVRDLRMPGIIRLFILNFSDFVRQMNPKIFFFAYKFKQVIVYV
jgi:translation initiation factor 3 subunit I